MPRKRPISFAASAVTDLEALRVVHRARGARGRRATPPRGHRGGRATRRLPGERPCRSRVRHRSAQGSHPSAMSHRLSGGQGQGAHRASVAERATHADALRRIGRQDSEQAAAGSERKTLSAMRRALGVAGDRQLAADTKRQRRETNRRRGPWRQRSSIRAACPREAARAASRVTRGAARASASARYAASYAVTLCRSSQILGSSTSCG